MLTNAIRSQTDSETGPILAQYMSRRECAAELGVSPRTLDRWNAARFGPPRTKLGGRWVYKRASVRAWLESHEQPQPRSAA